MSNDYPSIEELSKLVWKLNDEIDEQDVLDDYIGLVIFELSTNGGDSVIKFCDCPIWNTMEDERSFDDDKDEWEPLEPYIREVANKFLGEIKKIKI